MLDHRLKAGNPISGAGPNRAECGLQSDAIYDDVANLNLRAVVCGS